MSLEAEAKPSTVYRTALFIVLLWLCAPRVACAEIYKLAVPGDNGMKLYWWPQLQPPDGWVHDEQASRATDSNMLVPKGQSFSQSPAVVYGEALYKPQKPETHSLDQLIGDDKRDFQQHFPGIVISPLPDIKDGDGRSFKCLSYSPPAGKMNASWEWTAYGEEGDFYLIFTVSAHTQSALQAALPAFNRLIASYKEAPTHSIDTHTPSPQ
jgi:hypothetical protein